MQDPLDMQDPVDGDGLLTPGPLRSPPQLTCHLAHPHRGPLTVGDQHPSRTSEAPLARVRSQ